MLVHNMFNGDLNGNNVKPGDLVLKLKSKCTEETLVVLTVHPPGKTRAVFIDCLKSNNKIADVLGWIS